MDDSIHTGQFSGNKATRRHTDNQNDCRTNPHSSAYARSRMIGQRVKHKQSDTRIQDRQ
jgi:hypothetical protein